jgi:hypothetical protein
MYFIKVCFLILHFFCTSVGRAQDSSLVNIEYDQQKQKDFLSKNITCFKKKRDKNTKLHVAHYEGSKIFMTIEHLSNKYELTVQVKHQNKLRVILQDKNDVRLDYNVKNDFNFVKDMLDLESHALDHDLAFLKNVSCFVGPSNYFHTIENANNVIVVHPQVKYFSDNAEVINWLNNYLESFSNFSKLITKDTFSNGNTYQATESAYLREMRLSSDLIIRSQDNTMKLSPSGMMHINLQEHISEITLFGGTYNYCITNTLFSLGRGLITNGQEELIVKLPAYYVIYQQVGLTPNMSFGGEAVYFNLSELSTVFTIDFNRIFKAQKEYIANLVNDEIEVLLNDELPTTKKPILRLKIVTN